MYTVMVRKSDGVIVAHMSTETTKVNMLGNASESEYDVLLVEGSLVKGQPIVGATVILAGGQVTALVQASPPHPYGWKADYAAAKTDSERLVIIARKLGLI